MKRDIRSVYLPQDVWHALQLEAAETGSSISAIIRQAVADRNAATEAGDADSTTAVPAEA